MAYAARPSDFHSAVPVARASVRVPRPGLLTRAFNALFVNRSRHAERDVAAFLARRGYRLTDSIERELNERMFGGDWNSRR